ncbi:hypothetical protein AVEN_181487-1 [Araneus ventricosus]|uniref:Uncharacterized protein n=1 Tax=Araneus ventricosus TaxID=182803 RepID=A0A4Y2F4A3_ARAVE|nr:hypothetical protein AVEN_181487-1 [Araneus ventricosus]
MQLLPPLLSSSLFFSHPERKLFLITAVGNEEKEADGKENYCWTSLLFRRRIRRREGTSATRPSGHLHLDLWVSGAGNHNPMVFEQTGLGYGIESAALRESGTPCGYRKEAGKKKSLNGHFPYSGLENKCN